MPQEKNVLPMPEFIFDLNELNIGQYEDYIAAMGDNHFSDAVNIIAPCIVTWPFAHDVKDPATYRLLKVPEYKRLMKAIQTEMIDTFSEGN